MVNMLLHCSQQKLDVAMLSIDKLLSLGRFIWYHLSFYLKQKKLYKLLAVYSHYESNRV
jgi:hypothetical protein